ncbi:hypothetical protein [Arthrobacter psychrolactophilus]
MLRDLREVIKKHGASSFPVVEIERAMSLRGKPLAVTDALVDDILNLSYGKARTFAVLAVLFPHVDTRHQFHVNHVFPAALLDIKALRRQKNEDGTVRFSPEEIDDLLDLRDRLPNLELLPGLENIGKSAKIPGEWLATEYPSSHDRSAFLERNALPLSLPLSVGEYRKFFGERSVKLTTLIQKLLKSPTPEPDPSNTNASAPVDLDEELSEGDDSD